MMTPKSRLVLSLSIPVSLLLYSVGLFPFSLGSTPVLAEYPVSKEYSEETVPDMVFDNIDGGIHQVSDWRGKPLLMVNTASQCGYTKQYDRMQSLHEAYADLGLTVLAIPSDDFRQELNSEEEVKDFCEVNFNLTLPMTTIIHVKGGKAHPFYAWMREKHGWEPSWNFNKVLIGADGRVKGTWGPQTEPDSKEIVDLIKRSLTEI